MTFFFSHHCYVSKIIMWHSSRGPKYKRSKEGPLEYSQCPGGLVRAWLLSWYTGPLKAKKKKLYTKIFAYHKGNSRYYCKKHYIEYCVYGLWPTDTACAYYTVYTWKKNVGCGLHLKKNHNSYTLLSATYSRWYFNNDYYQLVYSRFYWVNFFFFFFNIINKYFSIF